MPEKYCTETVIEEAQDVALWHMNVRQGNNNDVSLNRVLEYYDKLTENREELLA